MNNQTLAPMDRAARNPAFAEATRRLKAGERDMARAQYLSLADYPQMLGPCLHQLGLIAADRGDTARAMALLGQALAVEPGLMLSYRALADLQERTGQLPAALGTLLSLGNILKARGREDEAVVVYRHILERDPLRYGAAVNLGTTLAAQHHLEEATRHLLRALRLYGRVDARMAGFPDELLAMLPESARPEEAHLPEGRPTGVLDMIEGVLTSLGKLLKEQDYFQAGLACYRRALELVPNYALAHWNLSVALLSSGDYAEGWCEYEWRWRWPEFPEPHRALAAPVWQGEPLEGRRILVWSEQGLGDTMQFLPLISRLQQQGAEVVLEVPATLVRLFAHNLPGVQVIVRADRPDTVKTDLEFDYVLPTMSLPHRLGLTKDQLPLAQNYLRPLPEDEEAWRERIPDDVQPRVGLVWAGRPQQSKDAMRSLSFEAMQVLAGTEGVRWYSVQVGPRRSELRKLPEGQVSDLAAHLKDFAHTAAALEQLDLVVTVDTSVAHLAGAMGKPVWVMSARPADWRWEEEDGTSSWYPTVRVFKQEQIGQWDNVVTQVQAALSQLGKPATDDAADKADAVS